VTPADCAAVQLTCPFTPAGMKSIPAAQQETSSGSTTNSSLGIPFSPSKNRSLSSGQDLQMSAPQGRYVESRLTLPPPLHGGFPPPLGGVSLFFLLTTATRWSKTSGQIYYPSLFLSFFSPLFVTSAGQRWRQAALWHPALLARSLRPPHPHPPHGFFHPVQRLFMGFPPCFLASFPFKL